MRFAFVLHLYTHTRHFHSVFEELLRRGHSVDVVGLPSIGAHHVAPVPPAHADHIRPIRWLTLPPPRTDVWGRYTDALRGSRNGLLYRHPRFADATVFRERAEGFVDPALAGLAPPGDGEALERAKAFHRRAERAIPSWRPIERMLRRGRYDAVLVSPLIFNEMLMLNDWVKACNRLGLPVGFPVFSWDNLTTKGTLHEMPDRIYVWNEIQRRECVELHGWDPALVRTCGAWRFDDFRALPPGPSRQDFCRANGFDPSKPIIVYLGSAPIVAATEFDFVLEWAAAIRSAPDPRVREANIFVRPHPRNLAAWRDSAALGAFERIAFMPVEATSLFQEREVHDQLAHADAVVALITSAVLEAALLGKPVHSVLTGTAGEGQRGTVHFDYLTEAGGGLLYLADTFDEHVRLLGPHLDGPGAGTRPDPRARAFVRAFVDPPGDSDETASEILADECEALAGIAKTPRRDGLAVRLDRWRLMAELATGRLPVRRSPRWRPPREA